MSVGVVEMWQSCQSGSGCSNGTGAVRPEQVRDRESIGQRIGARKRASLARTGARLSGASRSGAKHIPNATVEYPGGVNRDHIYEPTRGQKQSRTIIHQGSHNQERRTHASRPRDDPPSPTRGTLLPYPAGRPGSYFTPGPLRVHFCGTRPVAACAFSLSCEPRRPGARARARAGFSLDPT